MTVTMNEPVTIAPGVARFSWTSDLVDPTFHVWRDGVQIDTMKSNHKTLRIGLGEVIDVLDDDDVPATAAKGDVELSWQAVPDAVQYTVERETSPSVWTPEATVLDDGGVAFAHTARDVPSSTDTDFRVTAVDGAGNVSTAATRTVKVKKHPDTPDVTYSYDEGTNDLTIAAAA